MRPANSRSSRPSCRRRSARGPKHAAQLRALESQAVPVALFPVSLFPVLCFLVLAGFLACLGLFALAVTKVAAPDGRGHARGFVGGCAAMLALFLLCSLGLVGLFATVAAIGAGSLSDWNPIRRIELSRESARVAETAAGHASDAALSARFTLHGGAGGAAGELLEFLHGLLVDPGELDGGLSIHRRSAPGGEEFSVYEFRLPISEVELERFEYDLERGLDGLELHLPERMVLEFEGPERDGSL